MDVMLKAVILAFAVTVTTAILDLDFEAFKLKHGKSYTGEEEAYRYAIYKYNKHSIAAHNKLYDEGKSSFFMGENQFTDLTTEEYNSLTSCLYHVEGEGLLSEDELNTDTLPSSVNWKTKGYVTPVKHQQDCGSCWAFSTTGALEGAHFKSTAQLVSLSESNLVDCSSEWGTLGCNGGQMSQAFQYIIDNRGIDTEKSYPYVPKERPCRFSRQTIGATMSRYTNVTSGSEPALQQAVASIGPVSVAIDAGQRSFQLYAGGVYNEPMCSRIRLNHAVLVVGYGSELGKDYYLVKNSWGTRWGERGYIKMSRNRNNQCGIASVASYPTV